MKGWYVVQITYWLFIFVACGLLNSFLISKKSILSLVLNLMCRRVKVWNWEVRAKVKKPLGLCKFSSMCINISTYKSKTYSLIKVLYLLIDFFIHRQYKNMPTAATSRTHGIEIKAMSPLALFISWYAESRYKMHVHRAKVALFQIWIS